MENLNNIIEALIFSSEKPLTIVEIQQVIGDIDSEKIISSINQLQKEYEDRVSGIQILEVAGGYRMVTNRNYAAYVKNLYKIKHLERLTGPSLETLAIIAYKQPLTKLDIESLRGVNVDGVIKTLLEKNLIRTAGRKDVIGRPFLYATTQQFLEYFGLKGLSDLPPIEEFATMALHPQKVQEALDQTRSTEIQENKELPLDAGS
jgi:segregation and condensation protein B